MESNLLLRIKEYNYLEKGEPWIPLHYWHTPLTEIPAWLCNAGSSMGRFHISKCRFACGYREGPPNTKRVAAWTAHSFINGGERA